MPVVSRHIGPGQAALLHCGRPDGKIGFLTGETVEGLDAVAGRKNILLGGAQLRIHRAGHKGR